MFTKWLVALVVVGGIGGIGCGGGDAATEGESAEDALRTSGIKSVTVNRSAGFRPPPRPPATCNDSGHWEVDFTTRALKGDACIEGREITLDRELSADEFDKVKAAVSGVRVTARPTSCPTDVPTASMTVRRARSEVNYADARSSCWMPGTTAVKEPTMRALVEVLESLSVVAPSSPTIEGTLRELPMRGPRYAMQTSEDTVQLELTDDQKNEFVADRAARAIGPISQGGPVGGTRRIMHVEDLLVCPAAGSHVDCMPPTMSNVCANHTWIADHCEGVELTF